MFVQASREELVPPVDRGLHGLVHQDELIYVIYAAGGPALRPALRISFDDTSLCNYRAIFKILLEY